MSLENPSGYSGYGWWLARVWKVGRISGSQAPKVALYSGMKL